MTTVVELIDTAALVGVIVNELRARNNNNNNGPVELRYRNKIFHGEDLSLGSTPLTRDTFKELKSHYNHVLRLFFTPELQQIYSKMDIMYIHQMDRSRASIETAKEKLRSMIYIPPPPEKE